jgi:hypothetical protein
MGTAGSGAADLALTILLDHLHVPLADALSAYRGGFKTTDRRVVEAWMSHERLKEQLLVGAVDDCRVTEMELDHLLTTGFLSEMLAGEWERARDERESVQRARTKHLSYEKAKRGCGSDPRGAEDEYERLTREEKG